MQREPGYYWVIFARQKMVARFLRKSFTPREVVTHDHWQLPGRQGPYCDDNFSAIDENQILVPDGWVVIQKDAAIGKTECVIPGMENYIL